MKAVSLILAAVALASGARYSRTVSYEGEQIVFCPYRDEQSAAVLNAFLRNYDVDTWAERADGLDLRVTPANMENGIIKAYLADCEVIVENVEDMVVAWEKDFLNVPEDAEWFESYHTYDEIKAWYADLAVQYSSLATWTNSIGKSHQNRDNSLFKFTGNRGGSKRQIYWQCQIHAREWISGATCGFVINHFLENYGKDANVTAIMDSVVFHVVPIVNPDGYTYTWTNDRMWRKNRATNSGSTCMGVDLNRNYNSHWGEGGSSNVPCSDTYMGKTYNSEPETKNTQAAFKAAAPVIGAIDWHSYSQLILRPWGWTRTNSPDETFMSSVGAGMRDAARAVHGVTYTSQKSIDLYTTTGTASDWFYDTEATNSNGGFRSAGFTIELRDTGRYGFELPPDQIIPTGEEMVAAAIHFCQRVIATPLSP